MVVMVVMKQDSRRVRRVVVVVVVLGCLVMPEVLVGIAKREAAVRVLEPVAVAVVADLQMVARRMVAGREVLVAALSAALSRRIYTTHNMRIELKCRFTGEVQGYIDRPDLPEGAVVLLEDLGVEDVRSDAAAEEHGKYTEIKAYLRDRVGMTGEEARTTIEECDGKGKDVMRRMLKDHPDKSFGLTQRFPKMKQFRTEIEQELGVDDMPEAERREIFKEAKEKGTELTAQALASSRATIISKRPKE